MVRTKTSSGKIRWINKGGTLRLLSKKVIQRGTKFLALPSEIPEAFRDVVVPLDPIPRDDADEEAAVDTYSLKERDNGLFDVIDANGKVVNDKPMKELEAKEVLSRLNP